MDAKREMALVEAARRGERLATIQLYRSCRLSVYASLQRGVQGTSCQADELFQETMLRAFDELDRYDPERGRFLSWVHGIARNQLRGCVRRKGSTHEQVVAADALQPGEHPSPGVDPERLAQASEQVARVARCLDRLGSARMRDALELRTIDELSYLDVATALDISQANARKLVSRARARIRRCLEAGGRDA